MINNKLIVLKLEFTKKLIKVYKKFTKYLKFLSIYDIICMSSKKYMEDEKNGKIIQAQRARH